MLAFGPVPSRRLGHSLGINNIQPKACSYSCVYCQVGRTLRMEVERRSLFGPEEVLAAVTDKLDKVRSRKEPVDYLTFAPDGEPTLDINLGLEIEMVRRTGVKVAVITNASLLGREDVRSELMKADWVSLKVDAVTEKTWTRVNRPHRSLQAGAVQDGMLRFAGDFTGALATETMLVRGLNDTEESVGAVGDFLARLQPSVSYLAVPIRPPAEKRGQPPDEETVNRAFQLLSGKVDRLEYLIGYEGNAFASTGDAEADLLSITAVHPMRRDAVENLLAKAGAEWQVVDGLVARGEIAEVEHDGKLFYLRRFRGSGQGH
ncbi:radical SAM protein [candidate division WOR-3 bacterium]|nr:radical SAM protein [candidate division WOR-3 bacterium]